MTCLHEQPWLEAVGDVLAHSNDGPVKDGSSTLHHVSSLGIKHCDMTCTCCMRLCMRQADIWAAIGCYR